MAYESEGENGKILRSRLLGWMQEDLEGEADELLALRKALLPMMFVAPPKEPAVAAYVAYLLTEFAPLSEEFIDDLPPFVGDHDIRRFDKNESVKIMIHQSMVEDVMAEEVSSEDILAAGLRLR